MKAKTFLRMVYFALSIVSLGLCPACSALQGAVPQPAPSGDQPTAQVAKATPGAAHKAYIAPLLNAANPIPDDWPAFESPELGVQFRFPPLLGEVKYEFNDWPEREGDPSGTLAE